MKHKRSHCALRSMLAAVLAAVLAGCGAKPPPPESTAGGRQPAASTVTPGRSHLPESTPPDSMHATTFITEQYTLEKVVQAENGAIVRLNIHLPKLESDSADAARINAELARYYENDVLDYVDCPPAVDPAAWDLSIEMNWEASWYDDCVSLVVSSCYGGTDVPFHDGWCFDFESGKQLTGTAEGTQGRTEDGTELHFTLTDKDGKPCEFWAILLNDDGSPSGCSLKYRAGEQLFDRTQRQNFWKQSYPYITIVS